MANVINAVGEYTPVCLRNEFSSEPVRREKKHSDATIFIGKVFYYVL